LGCASASRRATRANGCVRPSARRASPSARRRSRRRTTAAGGGTGRRDRGAGCPLWQPDAADFGHREAIARRNRATGRALFMSLIHTCELNGANAFDYLTELQRHAEELKKNPSEWMPWNYRDTLARLATPVAA